MFAVHRPVRHQAPKSVRLHKAFQGASFFPSAPTILSCKPSSNTSVPGRKEGHPALRASWPCTHMLVLLVSTSPCPDAHLARPALLCDKEVAGREYVIAGEEFFWRLRYVHQNACNFAAAKAPAMWWRRTRQDAPASTVRQK